jgi:glycosyltransferase involved in cell wall biosynthesis
MVMRRRIVFVVNVDWYFVSHRLQLAISALKNGYEVFLISKDTGKRLIIESAGITFINIDFERSGINPLKEIATIFHLRKYYQKLKPDIIHHVTIKPSIYGSIAARICFKLPNLSIINAVSGLGYNFTDGRKSFLQFILLRMMKFGFMYKNSNFIFQNPDDFLFYQSLGFIKKKNYVIIKGAGVDEDEFLYKRPFVKRKLQVLLPARMLFDKGIEEFSIAAKKLEQKWKGKAEFIYAGVIDIYNPVGAKQEQIEKLLIRDYVIWIGYQNDIKSCMEKADIVCLPSYREGLPKALIEAMAIGRPIITTDTPGCRECVDEGSNGFLVPIKDSDILAKVINLLLSDQELRNFMGEESRKKMVKEFSLKMVIQETFLFYERVIKK